jgi:hypothetical protein
MLACMSAVSTVPIDLPAPMAMRGRWAAVAAVVAARGWGRMCHADGPVWHFDDSGGNWVELHHVGGGRAVLVGHDHEYSDTYYGEAATYFGEEETDLLAGAPAWWAGPVRVDAAEGRWVGFVYGFDGAAWARAPYDVQDGFQQVGLPAVSDEGCHDLVAELAKGAPGLAGRPPSPEAIAALIAADAQVTPAHVRAVIGPTGWDPSAASEAARRFLDA